VNRTLNRTEIEVALRVLCAISHRRLPDPNDERKLKQLLPDFPEFSTDELACEIVNRSVEAIGAANSL
jgi:hypothetical protein